MSDDRLPDDDAMQTAREKLFLPGNGEDATKEPDKNMQLPDPKLKAGEAPRTPEGALSKALNKGTEEIPYAPKIEEKDLPTPPHCATPAPGYTGGGRIPTHAYLAFEDKIFPLPENLKAGDMLYLSKEEGGSFRLRESKPFDGYAEKLTPPSSDNSKTWRGDPQLKQPQLLWNGCIYDLPTTVKPGDVLYMGPDGTYTLSPPDKPPSTITATSATMILEQAAATVRQRGVDYNNPAGERSMSEIVDIFNLLTGHSLDTLDGWRFMIVLKLVRAQKNSGKLDSWLDLSAYAALAGEEGVK